MARGLELVRDLHRERYFGARCDEHDLARSRGTAQMITAFGAKIIRDVMAQRRKGLAGQREQRRPVFLREGGRQAFGGLAGTGGESQGKVRERGSPREQRNLAVQRNTPAT